MLEADGDIVRGLGFVALYAAYLEEQIENLRLMLATVEQVADRETRWPIGRRIDKVLVSRTPASPDQESENRPAA